METKQKEIKKLKEEIDILKLDNQAGESNEPLKECDNPIMFQANTSNQPSNQNIVAEHQVSALHVYTAPLQQTF